MSERDDIARDYEASSRLESACAALFVLSASLSVADIVTSSSVWFVSILAAISFMSYVIIEVVDDVHFWYKAESERRENAIETAFDIDLSSAITKGYYNNEAESGILCYILNIYESAFFSRSIARAMFPRRILLCAVVIGLLVAVFALGLSAYYVTATQAVFSTYFVIGTVNFIVYSCRIGRVDEKFYAAFVTRQFDGESEQAAPLLANAIEYEAIKAHYKVRLSSKIFERENLRLSGEWEDLKRRMSEKLFES